MARPKKPPQNETELIIQYLGGHEYVASLLGLSSTAPYVWGRANKFPAEIGIRLFFLLEERGFNVTLEDMFHHLDAKRVRIHRASSAILNQRHLIKDLKA
jgi:hypothetical protein